MMDKTFGNRMSLKRVKNQLIKDLEETTLPHWRLGEKYRLTRQAIYAFCKRKGIKRPKRDHKEDCPICQGLIAIASQDHSDFISSTTIQKQLKNNSGNLKYHIGILRKKGLISQKFGRLHSKKAERAYQIYFKKRLPVGTIGRQVGFKNFYSIIRKHKLLGWDVPAPLFTYDRDERIKTLKMVKEKRRR